MKPKRIRYIYIYETSLYKDNNVKEVGNIKLIIRDNGEGFDLNCNNGNKFGRFDDWLNDSKSTKNKGCGRAQFLHYFKNVIIYSKNKDTNNKFTWSFSKEEDLKDITTTTSNNDDDTRIEMNDCVKTNEFYDKVKDINKLTKELTIACLLSLIEKENITIEIKYYINKKDYINKKEKPDDEGKIDKEYINNLLKDPRTQELKVKYSKVVKKSEVNKDDFDFEYVDDKQVNFNIKEYKIFNEDIDNQVYLCANNQVVKNITKDVGLLENFTLTNNDNNNFKLLYLIDSVYLNDKCNESRDDFEFEIKDEIEKQIKKDKKEARYTNLTIEGKEKTYLFYETIKNEISKDINTTHPQIKQKIDDNKKETKDYLLQLGFSENDVNNQLKEDKIYDVNNEAIKMAEKQGKNNITRQKEIVDLQKKIMEYINNNNFNETELKTKIEQQVNLIDEANKNELTCYILRRKYIIERLKKVFNSNDDKVKEQELHNLFATKRNNVNSNQYDKTNLWLLDDKFMVFDKLFSDEELDKITKELFKNDKTFNKNLNVENKPEENTEEKKLERAKKRRPDIVLFKDINNNLRKIVLIEFKRPNADDYDYNKGLYQLNCYANYIAKQQKVVAEYFGFLLVNTKLEIGDEFVKNSLKGEYNEIYNLSDGCRSFAKAKNLYDDNEKPIGYLNTQVIPSNAIINDAEARNFVFEKILNRKETKQ